jgi:hypothetical protein
VLIEAYGTEAVAWAPETIMMELQDDFNVQLPKVNMDKLVVGISLLTSDDFYRRPSRFVQMCNVLAGSELSASFDRADATECAWGMTEAMLLAPPEPDDDEPFSNEIRAYVGQVLAEEGIHNPPDLLKIGVLPQQHAASGLDAEDPEMFAAQYGIRADRSAEIKEMLEDNVQEMLQQLATFSGSTKDELLKRMRQGAA